MRIKAKKLPLVKQKKILNLIQTKNYNEAEKLALKMSKKFPFHHFIFKALGEIYMQTGRLLEAISAFKKSVELSNNEFESYYNLGNALSANNQYEESLVILKKAIDIKPNDAFVCNNIGNTFKKLNKKKEAIEYYEKAIDLKKDFGLAYKNLGLILHEIGEFKEAEKKYEKALENSPQNSPVYIEANHLLSSLIGKDDVNETSAYARQLFDKGANDFEELLVEKLNYNLPKIVSNFLIEFKKGKLLGSVLDMGCGTGLLGKEIKQYCNYLEGVDISKSMLEEALSKKAYNKLVLGEIKNYLSKSDLNFDFFISLDTFIYIGDIEEIFKLIVSRNNSNGKFIFSTEYNEMTNNNGYFLEKSGRFSHSHTYIERLCSMYDYNLVHFEKVKLRKERKSHLIGGLYVLEF